MVTKFNAATGVRVSLVMALLTTAAAPVGAVAQMQEVDPNTAIDADLVKAPPATSTPTTPAQPAPLPPQSAASGGASPTTVPEDINADVTLPGSTAPVPTVPSAPGTPGASNGVPVPAPTSATYARDDLIGAAQSAFGEGAKDIAGMIENILRKQGEPNGYIVGREAGGALMVGVRYGSGTLSHKTLGMQKVYWTGPSIGFDVGANAASTFVLVYNLNDMPQLYKRFGAGEGSAYVVGGLTASYLRDGDVVLIPIRVGAGLRLGINAGYMRFTRKANWIPF